MLNLLQFNHQSWFPSAGARLICSFIAFDFAKSLRFFPKFLWSVSFRISFLLCADITNWNGAGDKAGGRWGQHLWRLGDLELAIIRRLVPEWGLFYAFGILKYWLIFVFQSHELHSNACILHRRLDSQCRPLPMWTRGTLLTLPTEDCFEFIEGDTKHVQKWWFRYRVWWVKVK